MGFSAVVLLFVGLVNCGVMAGIYPTCTTPSLPKNGGIQGSIQQYYSVGTVLYYSCNYGYVSHPQNSWTACRLAFSGTYWENTPPTCTPVDCGSLSAPDGGSVLVAATTFGCIATYTCNNGFTLIGVSKRQCQANGQWSGSTPSCQVLDCGSLSAPANGAVQVTSTTVGGVATYQCNTGFNLVGAPTRTCQQANGLPAKWSGSAPQCNPVDCGPLKAPYGGSVSGSSTTFGSTATYACNYGFTLVGVSRVQCQANGQWSGPTPSCKVLDCGSLSAPANGAVQVTSTTVGGVATYQCDTGFNLVGVPTRTCQQTNALLAQWSGSAPQCNPVDCGPLSAPYGGSVSVSTTTFGSSATYACKYGLILVGVSQVQCQANGQWSGPTPSCQVQDCGSLSAPTNGAVQVTSTTVGGVATYQCDTGFNLVGVPTRKCQQTNGLLAQWSGSAPQCNPVDCGPLSAPYGGSVSVSTTTFGSSATYACKYGLILVGVSQVQCQANGQWSGPTPSCQVQDCGSLSAPTNGAVQVTSTTVGGVATYQCNTGFNLVGAPTRKCQQANGLPAQWSGSAPQCNPVDCGPLSAPYGGSVSVSTTTFGSSATYACKYGLILVGVSQVQCQANGQWSGSVPQCNPVDCGPLSAPYGGTVTISTTLVGGIATYNCDAGFTLSAVSTRQCLSSGTWSGVAPICNPKYIYKTN